MAGRRAIKAVNWGALAERIPEHEKMNFAAFKAKSEQYLRKAEELPSEPPKLDWDYYKKNINAAGFVDKFQKEYDSLKVSYPKDTYTSIIEDQSKQVEAAIKQFIDESNKRIAENEAEIKKLEGMMKYRDMTMEDFKDTHPELAFDINRPTIFPHTPEFQPDPEGTPIKPSGH